MFWQLRFLRNAAFASIPGAEQLRRWKRSLLPYDATLDDDTLRQGMEIIQMLHRHGCSVTGRTVVEIGSGWKPAIPLLMRMAGASRVIMVDSQRLLDVRLLMASVEQLTCRASTLFPELDASALSAVFPPLDPEQSLESALDKLGLAYLAPHDGRQLPLRPGEASVVYSRAVLEHIPVDVLRGLFREFARILEPGLGYACHIIDNSDHWAHGDRRLSMLNFLRFSDGYWQRLSINPLDYMNRLRHSQYLELIESSGFKVVADESEPDARALADLNHLPLHPQFKRFGREDLAILTSRIVAVRRPEVRLS